MAETTLDELIRIAGARWAVEECFRSAKQECGLDGVPAGNDQGVRGADVGDGAQEPTVQVGEVHAAADPGAVSSAKALGKCRAPVGAPR
ncbi:hypothetical protein [Streptomyces xanthophaeus]|uniref:hypothetical protein n=1 Tax=Streptomyces xanthophaeus TaxID=67385 RepID=UPI00233F0499|nr:hypothetical protein [Streptomyces xanthophaeus]